LTAASGNVLKMSNQSIYGSDPLPTEAELQIIAKNACNILLTELCTKQCSTPHFAPLHSVNNHAFVDYYQRLCDLGGHASLLPAEERKLAGECGWDEQRIEDLRMIIKLREEKDLTRFGPAFTDPQLRQLGYEPSDLLRWLVELTFYKADGAEVLHGTAGTIAGVSRMVSSDMQAMLERLEQGEDKPAVFSFVSRYHANYS